MTNETHMPNIEETEDSDDDFVLSPTEMMELAELEASMKEEHSTEEKTESSSSSTGMSYADIYASVLLNEEIVITIPAAIVEKVKMGLRNHKARQLSKLKESDVIPDSSYLVFAVEDSKETEDAVDLTVTLKEKTTVPVLKMKIPDNTF